MFGFIGCRAGDFDVTEFGMPVQRHLEVHIGEPVRFVRLNIWLDHRFEEAVAPQKFCERILRFLDIHRRVRFLRNIAGNLKQPRIRKLLGAAELVNAEINRGLRNKHHTDAFEFRPQIHLYVLKLSGALESDDALVDLVC